MYALSLSCVALILHYLPSVGLINIPNNLTREAGKDMLFMFNVSTSISKVRWGIRDGDTSYLKPVLVTVAKINGVRIPLNNVLSYAGRVSFVGDLSKGQAWFKITNLNINDTNQYMAQILTQGASSYKYVPLQLTVIMPPLTTATSLLTSTIWTDAIVRSTKAIPFTRATSVHLLLMVFGEIDKLQKNASTTSSFPAKDPFVSDNNCTPIIAISVTINVLLVLVVVFLLLYIWTEKTKAAREVQARMSPNVKDDDLGVYENGHEMEETSFDTASYVSRRRPPDNKNVKKYINRHQQANELPENVGTSLESSAGVSQGRSVMEPQLYQDLKRGTTKPQALYESLDHTNMGNNGNGKKLINESKTYEPLHPNKAGTAEYQSLTGY